MGPKQSENASEESWIDVRVFEPDGSERWGDRYYGYVGQDAWVSGVNVDLDGNIYVAGLDIYAYVSRGDNTAGEYLHDQLLISWSAHGERRFRSRTPPCGDGGGGPPIEASLDGGGGPGLGIAADGRVYAVGTIADDTAKVCIHVYSPTGEPEPALTADVPDHEPGIQPLTQWDGSFSISGRTAEGPDTEILARYGQNGEQLWALRHTLPSLSSYYPLPRLVGDGRTVVGHNGEIEEDTMVMETWMIDSAGELDWRVDGTPYGVNCANEVIVRQPSGSFALHDPDDGQILHEWNVALPGISEEWDEFFIGEWGEFIPSPDGAVYVTYPVGDDFGFARLEPESSD